MCGIIAYAGKKEAYLILLTGLEKLEYRGYDSAGICTQHNSSLLLNKHIGRVATLNQTVLPGNLGIAHTRWATHGPPSDKNSHPFLSQNQQFAVVHNGIIENYLELKEHLRTKSNNTIQFTSDTDSEVITHLIELEYNTTANKDFKQAILNTIQHLIGAYAFCVINNDTNEIIGARNGSPLVIGINKEHNEHFLASDISAIIEHTRKVIYLNDFECAKITPHNIELFTFQNQPIQNINDRIKTINWNLEQSQKQGYKHFMLKEIMEQPTIIKDSLTIPITLPKPFSQTNPPKKIIITACGTALYAGHIAKYLIEQHTKIPTNIEIASELRYKQPLFHKDDLVIVISQSGETADTLAALRIAKQHHIKTMGIINVIDSTIAREVDHVIYTRAGPEIGVASTKALTAQLIILYKIIEYLTNQSLHLDLLPNLFTTQLNPQHQNHIQSLAEKYISTHHMMYIGRNINYPLAQEGALKLKEISYIHAEAYPAGELKHGPIALISEDFPTLAICPKDTLYDKTISNIQEIKARSGPIIAITTEGDTKITTLTNDIISIPNIQHQHLNPFLILLPLQLFAYYLANKKECDIDKPRNLAKSVTVE